MSLRGSTSTESPGLRPLRRAAVVCAAVALPAATAFAGPGDHIRLDDAVTIIPTLDVGTEVRTNVYRAETSPTPGAHLRISPGLSFTAEGPDHRFGVSGDWDLRKYYFVGEVARGWHARLTPGERIRRLDRFNDFAIGAEADLMRRSAVGIVFTNRATLRNANTDFEYADQPFNTQFRNVLRGGIRVSPTSALTITPGGVLEYDDYRIASMPNDRYNVRSAYGPRLEARWSFLPRTALVLDGRYVVHHWQQNQVEVDGVPTGLALPDSEHLRGMVRLEGQLTSRLYANLGLGFGGAWYDETTVEGLDTPTQPHLDGPFDADLTGLDGLLAVAQLRYLLSEKSEVHAGYEKSFEDSFFTNYFTYHYLYAGTNLQLGRLTPALKYGVRLEEYQGIETRRDAFHRLNLSLGYELSDWAGLNGGVGLQARESEEFHVQYEDWTVHLMGRFQY